MRTALGWPRPAALFVFALAAQIAPAGQTQPPPSPSQTAQFRAAVNLVEVDVTVADRAGRPVVDLTSADFDVREQGVPQKIEAIYLVTSDPAVLVAPVPAPAAAGEPTIVPVRRPLKERIFVFAFDLLHLSPGGLTRARRAAEAFLKSDTPAGDVFGLVIDGRMINGRLTTDKNEVLKGLEQASKPNNSRFIDSREPPRILDDFEASQIARNDEETIKRAIVRLCEDRPDDCRFARELVMEKARRMEGTARRDAQTSLQTLDAVASGLGRFPGVKQLVFFSEGFFADNLTEQLRTIIGRAARSSVRVSALDARGLLTGAGQSDLFGAAPTSSSGDFQPADVHSDVLTSLAVDTGGVLARNQNNLGPSLEQVSRQASSYYVIGYAPDKPLDGTYRPITVTVRRQGLVVRARHGYLAVASATPPTAPAAPAAAPSPAPGRPISPPAEPPNAGTASVATVAPPPPAAAATTPPAAPGVPVAAPDANAPSPYRLRPGSADRVAALAGEPGSAPTGASTRADDLARQGWDFYAKGDIEHARDKLADAISTRASQPWVSYALGLAEFGLNHFDAAASAWEDVRRRLPEYEPAYFDLATAYLSLKRSGDAIAVLREAARRWPNDPEPHNALGVTLVRRDAVDDAIAEFKRATEAAPGDGLGFFNLGRAYQLRYSRVLQNASRTAMRDMTSIGEEDRLKAIDAYTRYLKIGGPFEKDARDALAALGWKFQEP